MHQTSKCALALAAFVLSCAPSFANDGETRRADGEAAGKSRGTGRLQSAGAVKLNPKNPTEVIGIATSGGSLYREKHQVTFNGTFTELQPNGAYTAWWFFFNQPENCDATPCDETDFFEKGLGQAFNAGGFITDANGHGQFTASLPRGLVPNGAVRFSDISQAVFGFPVSRETETGLRRTMLSDFRVIVRYHGDADAAIIGEQLGDYLGGCGPNGQGCFDDQLIVFLPEPREGR